MSVGRRVGGYERLSDEVAVDEVQFKDGWVTEEKMLVDDEREKKRGDEGGKAGIYSLRSDMGLLHRWA